MNQVKGGTGRFILKVNAYVDENNPVSITSEKSLGQNLKRSTMVK